MLSCITQEAIITSLRDTALRQITSRVSRYVQSVSINGSYSIQLTHLKIVLADGTIEKADATKNSDLFWALKGGGPNFGIVTNYELHTVPLHKIWYEVLVVSNEEAHAVLDAFTTWQNTSASSDTKGTVAVVMALQYITLGFVYSEPSVERPAAFSAFNGITPLTTAVPPTNGTVSSLAAVLSVSDAPGR